jgi:hypothetical protein
VTQHEIYRGSLAIGIGAQAASGRPLLARTSALDPWRRRLLDLPAPAGKTNEGPPADCERRPCLTWCVRPPPHRLSTHMEKRSQCFHPQPSSLSPCPTRPACDPRVTGMLSRATCNPSPLAGVAGVPPASHGSPTLETKQSSAILPPLISAWVLRPNGNGPKPVSRSAMRVNWAMDSG